MFPLLLALFSLAFCQIPLMNHKDMFFWGPDSATVKMLFVIDFQCPDSAASWPTMQQLISVYAGALQIRVMGLPLPYHHNAFFAHQASRIVAELNGTKQSFFDFGTLLFQNQGAWSNTATQSITPLEVISKLLGPMANQCCNVKTEDLAKQMGWISTQNIITREEWKNCAGLGAYGTPTFYVNGAMVQMSSTASVADWRRVLDPLV